jgi:hypothetical protein
MKKDFMGNRRSLQGNVHHIATGGFATFANRIRDFAGFAHAHTHAAFSVAHNHERAEIETTSAFHDFCGTIDEDDLLDQLFTALRVVIDFGFGPATSASRTPAAAITAATAALLLRRLLRLRLLGLLLLRGRLSLGGSACYNVIFVSHNIFSLLRC